MRILLLALILVAILASTALCQQCVVKEDAIGTVDQKTMLLLYGAMLMAQSQGNLGGVAPLGEKLTRDGKLVDIDKGEKVQIIDRNVGGEWSIVKVRIPGKGELWVDPACLRCK